MYNPLYNEERVLLYVLEHPDKPLHPTVFIDVDVNLTVVWSLSDSLSNWAMTFLEYQTWNLRLRKSLTALFTEMSIG